MKKNLIFFEIFFDFFLVYGKSQSHEKCKRGAFGSFRTSILLQNREKNEGETLWRQLKNLRKKSHKAEKTCTKKSLVKGGQTSKTILINLYAKWHEKLPSVAVSGRSL